MKNGCKFVAQPINVPRESQIVLKIGASTMAHPTPTIIVTAGVTRISIFVSLETSLPTSQAIIATNKTASGPPEPPNVFVACPTAHKENNTSGGASNA